MPKTKRLFRMSRSLSLCGFLFLGSRRLLWASPTIPSDTTVTKWVEINAELKSELDTFNTTINSSWNGTKYAGAHFGADIYPAENGTSMASASFYTSNVIPWIDAMQALGIKSMKVTVSFPILYKPYYDYLAGGGVGSGLAQYNATLTNYVALAAYVHNKGMKLVVDSLTVHPLSNPSVTSYYSTLSLASYKAGRSAVINTLAENMSPDYLIVQTEPLTEVDDIVAIDPAKTLSNPSTDAAMISMFIANLQSDPMVTGLHTTMLLGSGMGTWQPNFEDGAPLTPGFKNAISSLSGLDLIDIHVYPIYKVGGNDFLGRVVELSTAARTAGKKVGMSECWPYKEQASEAGLRATSNAIYSRDIYNFWTAIDEQFLQEMVNVSHWQNLEYMSPFFDKYFLAYTDFYHVPTPCGPFSPAPDVQCNTSTGVATLGNLATAAAGTAMAQSPIPYTPTAIAYKGMIAASPPSSQPPTVAVAAHATPTVVNDFSTSIALTVTGADPNDPESSLTYTWAPVVGATYSGESNGTNDSNAIVVKVASNGTYIFPVTIRNPAGGAVTSQVQVVVGLGTGFPWSAVAGKNVKAVTALVTDVGGRVDWSKGSNNLIAYDAYDKTLGYYQLYTMKPDGSAQTCVSCGNALWSMHTGNPLWDPTGQYLLFQAQDPSLGTPTHGEALAQPGIGINNNLWIMNSDGTNARQLTTVAANGGTLHAQFSADGSKLAWEQTDSSGKSTLAWANFNGAQTPPITSITTLQDTQTPLQLYETSCFSNDGQSIYFSGFVQTAETVNDMDIYRTDLAGTTFTNLTNSPGVWDEHAHLNPSGNLLMHMHGIGSNGRDYYLTDPLGGNEKQLTYFNDSTSPEYISGGAVANDHSWSVDNKSSIALISTGNLDARGYLPGTIVRIDYNQPTVQTVVTATPGATSALTTTFAIVAADGAGPATNLTYKWSAIPSDGVTFSANNSGAAASTVATFANPGAYVIQVVIQDIAGLTATSSISTTVGLASSSGSTRIYPNPWRVDRFSGPITFDHLSLGTGVTIYDLAGHEVKSLSATGNTALWDLTNDHGDKVASGLYLYVTTDSQGGKVRGKFSIIK